MKAKTAEGCLISVRIIFKNYISPRGKVQPVGQFTEKNWKLLNFTKNQYRKFYFTKEGEFGPLNF